MNRSDVTSSPATRAGLWAGAALLGAALTATWVERRSRRAERTRPPTGRLLGVDGVRLHVERRGYNRAAVAMANKNARVIQALLSSDQSYERPAMA
jgi:hypothetical protein